MFIDKELEFSDGQAITASAASTNLIDISQTVDVVPGVPLKLRLQIDEAFNLLTTLTVAVQTDSTAAFSSAATVVSKDIALADLTLGADFDLGVLLGPSEQFIRLYYTVTGTAPTTGQVSAFIEVYDAPEGNIGAIPGNL